MHPKIKSTPGPTDAPTARTIYSGRSGLAAYTVDPASFPSSRVVYYNDKFVVINDLFPKASVHLLILPRDTTRNVMSPQDAFDDPEFLADCREEVKKVRGIVASELRRKFGKFSETDKPYLAAMEMDDPPDPLPSGRDWDKEIISGIHANPSMSHVHIHVLSRDMVSECMKKSNHYLSFTTDFLVDMDQFPLSEDDYRRRYSRFPGSMSCWRCGKDYENRTTKLRAHLQEELEKWKRE